MTIIIQIILLHSLGWVTGWFIVAPLNQDCEKILGIPNPFGRKKRLAAKVTQKLLSEENKFAEFTEESLKQIANSFRIPIEQLKNKLD